MKKILLLAGLLLATSRAAQAQTQMFTKVSSATYCTVSVSTSVVTRVDNYNGGCNGLMYNRNEIKLSVPTGNTTMNCGYDVNVSTPGVNLPNTYQGEEWVGGAKGGLSLPSSIGYWCLAQAAAGPQKINVQQAAMNRQPN